MVRVRKAFMRSAGRGCWAISARSVSCRQMSLAVPSCGRAARFLTSGCCALSTSVRSSGNSGMSPLPHMRMASW